jgi:hypothetical protein
MKTAATMPPSFSTAERDSFARKTLQERKPAIVDRVIGANRFAGERGMIRVVERRAPWN